MCKRIFRLLILVSLFVFSQQRLFGMEEKSPQLRFHKLYELMHDKMMGIQLSIFTKIDDYYEKFLETQYGDLDNLSAYNRILNLLQNPDDIILNEIQKAEDLIEKIGRCTDEEYVSTYRSHATNCLDTLNLISGILVDMASLPVCKYVVWVKGFDDVINFLHTPRFQSVVYGQKIHELLNLMKTTGMRISDVIERLLQAAITKEKDKGEREKLEKELERRRQEDQIRREADARALVEAEQKRKKAEDEQKRAQEEAKMAEENLKKANESEKKRLEKLAQDAMDAQQKAELEVQRQRQLAEQAERMDKEAKKQLEKSVNGLEDVKALLEKIRRDVLDNNFKELQKDINEQEISFADKNFPGLLKSLNDYLSDATFGLFIQMFELISQVLGNSTTTQKNQIFSVLKTTIPGISLFYQLVCKSGIIGSKQKGVYKIGSVKPENLIKLINAYKGMCLATQVQGTRTEETIKGELFGRSDGALDITIVKLKELTQIPHQFPTLPPRDEPMKSSILKLKKSLEELNTKTDLLKNKLEKLGQALK